ncbi:MAG: hypothetical protein GXY83_18435 [Rhodopirellula sp.]|nr:hypothetical protein [Rhodopirellula sp.]
MGNELTPQATEPHRDYKLDLAYFTEVGRCPLMVRRGARRAFELFLHLAHQFFHNNGQPVLVDHTAMCQACGLNPEDPHARSAISRLLRSLQRTFRVIDYEPVQRRRPEIRLAPAQPDANVLNPRHYIYFQGGWSGPRRATFNTLGPRAFATEYMYWIAEYESALARIKHNRPYWFFPLAKISEVYHVSTDFAGAGLRGLVELGVMRVVYGQFGLQAPNDEFGAANRYYFKGLGEFVRRQWELENLQVQYQKELVLARILATKLTNGQTVKNVRGLCELLAAHGEASVLQAIEQVATLPTRSLKRRLAYVTAIVKHAGQAADGCTPHSS